MADDAVTVSEYAQAKGISKQAVSKNVKRFVAAGVLTVRADGGRLYFKPSAYEAAKALLADPARANATATKAAAEGAAPIEDEDDADDEAPAAKPAAAVNGVRTTGYQHHRGEREAAEAALSKLELAEKLGRVTQVAQVQHGAFEQGRAARDAVFGTLDRLADELATLTDPRTIKALIRERLGPVWNKVCDDAERAADTIAQGGDAARGGDLPEGVGGGGAAAAADQGFGMGGAP